MRIRGLRCGLWMAGLLAGVFLPSEFTRGEALAQGAATAPQAESSPTSERAPKSPASWTFHNEDKPTKVIVLAGSIGAKKRQAYHHQLESVCGSTEFINLSIVGHAVQGLRKHWIHEVSRNRRLARTRAEGEERWALFGGGLNNIGTQGHYSSAHYMRELFSRMHRDGYKVIATSLTPWGSEDDRRWQGYTALQVHRTTLALARFLSGDMNPAEALGSYLRHRKKSLPSQSFTPEELPDIVVDLYDSDLRARDAEPTDGEGARKTLKRSKVWREKTREMSNPARAVLLQQDALELSRLPRWYMRTELQGFDPIHPNDQGHLQMAEILCPSLPDSWHCDCRALKERN